LTKERAQSLYADLTFQDTRKFKQQLELISLRVASTASPSYRRRIDLKQTLDVLENLHLYSSDLLFYEQRSKESTASIGSAAKDNKATAPAA
jgi:hypothetical protein